MGVKAKKKANTFKLKIYKVFNSNKKINIIDLKIKVKNFGVKSTFITCY
jgi:hypothetical protein